VRVDHAQRIGAHQLTQAGTALPARIASVDAFGYSDDGGPKAGNPLGKLSIANGS
jgi:hypothetical protein